MLAAAQYLNLFAERINGLAVVALGVSMMIMIFSWLTVSGQILRVAQDNPTKDLRCE